VLVVEIRTPDPFPSTGPRHPWVVTFSEVMLRRQDKMRTSLGLCQYLDFAFFSQQTFFFALLPHYKVLGNCTAFFSFRHFWLFFFKPIVGIQCSIPSRGGFCCLCTLGHKTEFGLIFIVFLLSFKLFKL
jgi:hypothetical protein